MITPEETADLRRRLITLEEENTILKAEAKGSERLFLALSEKYATLRHQVAIDEIDRQVTLRALDRATEDLVEFKGRKG